jgi:site-specific recombinase
MSSYGKISSSSSSSSSSANPFLRLREESNLRLKRNAENKAKWEQALAQQKEELKAWFDTCPAHLLKPNDKAWVLQEAEKRLDPDTEEWEERCYPTGTREIISRVQDQWLQEAECLDWRRNLDKDTNRLRFLIQSLCQDQKLARKSWVQEAIDLATKKGFHNLAQNVIPNIRQWRQELWDTDNAWI